MKKVIEVFLNNFSWKGLIIVCASLLPSIIMGFFPPKQQSETKDKMIFTVFEIAGRIAVILILLFSKKSFSKRIDLWLIAMCVCAVIYYIAWIRYFCFGRTFALLYKPLWFIPVPLAVFPVLAFAFAAIWGRNIPLGIAVIALAIGHIPQSYNYYLQIK